MEVGGHWPVLGDKKTHEWPPRTQKKEKERFTIDLIKCLILMCVLQDNQSMCDTDVWHSARTDSHVCIDDQWDGTVPG